MAHVTVILFHIISIDYYLWLLDYVNNHCWSIFRSWLGFTVSLYSVPSAWYEEFSLTRCWTCLATSDTPTALHITHTKSSLWRVGTCAAHCHMLWLSSDSFGVFGLPQYAMTVPACSCNIISSPSMGVCTNTLCDVFLFNSQTGFTFLVGQRLSFWVSLLELN